ncbi:MAG TPA: MBL fold metallo-hydrolase [Armatimonadota bacterium]|nr:MBL fold metallo-hydrolase [Armatimonadota bacterium]
MLTAQSLASGSSGNSILVRNERDSVLIDAGIGIKKLTSGLLQAGVNPTDLSAILITHEHGDHITGAVRMARRYRVLLVSNAPTLANISGAGSVPHKILEPGEEMVVGSLSIRPFPVSHDATCPVGYTIKCSSGATIVSATDTGKLTPQIRNEAETADLLIIESNHDVGMVVSGPYPWHLKRRILGDWGHLSNDTTARLLLDLAESGRKRTVWLAHLSKTNNTPRLAMSTAQKTLSQHIGSTITLGVALRDIPSLNWQQGHTLFQLSLFSPAVPD